MAEATAGGEAGGGQEADREGGGKGDVGVDVSESNV